MISKIQQLLRQDKNEDVYKIISQNYATPMVRDNLYEIFDWLISSNQIIWFKKISALVNCSSIKNAEGDSLLHLSVSTGSLTITKFLVERGLDVNIQDEDGDTPLMDACKFGQRKIVAYLLAQGADSNVINKKGYTALTWAVLRGQDLQIIRRLISSGANINHQDNNGKSILRIATMIDNRPLIKLLRSYGVATDKHQDVNSAG